MRSAPRALAALALCTLLCSVAAEPARALWADELDATEEEGPQSARVARGWNIRRLDPSEEVNGPPRRTAAARRPAAPATSPAGWPYSPIQVNVDVGGAGGDSVPIVVVPVPISVRREEGCEATPKKTYYAAEYDKPARRPPSAPLPAELNELISRLPPRLPRPPRPSPPRRPAAAPTSHPPPLDESEREPPLAYVPERPESARPPKLQTVFTSQELVEEFRAQKPTAPDLPPMMLSEFDASERAPLPVASDPLLAIMAPDVQSPALPPPRARGRDPPPRSPVPLAGGRGPSTPRYDNLALMRGKLTVPRADYSEPYTVWFDQESGNYRVDFHGGSTTTYRTLLSDGRMQLTEVRLARAGDASSRRCAVATTPAAAADRAHPALPDPTQFSFGEYEESPSGLVEVWRRVVVGRAGEQGGARGEALTTRHELRLTRSRADLALPLRYSVAADSSVLGGDCDGYEHFYQYDTPKQLEDDFFNVNLEKLCDVVEYLNASSLQHAARLQPLRQFTAAFRDPIHDEDFTKYKVRFERQYSDDKEEAVRKNVLMQSVRFVTSGNRQGATAELGAALFADRLGAEVRLLLGVEPGLERIPGEAFPHSREDVRAQVHRLPSSFDWRARGGVTPVRNQGVKCSSCWAFAVVGAVEGALFRLTRRLVPLSEQALIDCGKPFGARGCLGTWPSFAYNYVQARGLPAQGEYPAFMEMVGTCTDENVPSQTRISGHVNVTSFSVPALKVAIRRHAPSVVLVHAECKSFLLYKKGVLYDDRCHKKLNSLRHAVLAVGWGEKRGEPHFILKNSWSETWGDGGYIRVQARSNTCGVLTMPSYPRLEDPDVAQPVRRATAAAARPFSRR